MEFLVVGARLATCALSNKNEATVIKTRLRWGTPKVVQKYSMERTRLQSSKGDSDGYCKSGPKVAKTTPWSSPMECSIDPFHPQ